MAFRCVQLLLYFQRSIKHSLSEESKQRLESTKLTTAVTTKCLSPFAHVSSIICLTASDRPVFFKNHLSFLSFACNVGFLSLWERCNGCEELGGGSVLPISCSNLGGMRLGWGEVISCSNCKVGCKRGRQPSAGVSLTSLVHIMASWRCICILALKMKETKLSKNAQHKQFNSG